MDDIEEYVDFNSMANTYDITRGASPEILSILKNDLLNSIPENIKVNNILEIGCGTGRVSKIFATSGFHVTGIDPSRNMLDIVTNKSKSEGWNFNGVEADARHLPFDNDSFDLVYCVNVLHLIKDWHKALSEIIRVSKNKLFANISLNQNVVGNLWPEYFKKLDELSKKDNKHFKIKSQTIIGGNLANVLDYMKSQNFTINVFESTNITNDSKEKIIQGLYYKDISSQRFIPDEYHKEVVQYLEKNNYFLDQSGDRVKLEEKLTIQFYFKG